MKSSKDAHLEALSALDLLDTTPGGSLDRIATRMTVQLFDLPVAAVSLTDLPDDNYGISSLAGQGLRLHAVAPLINREGVETEQAQGVVREAGCERAMGYLPGRPTEVGDAPASWRRYRGLHAPCGLSIRYRTPSPPNPAVILQ